MKPFESFFFSIANKQPPIHFWLTKQLLNGSLVLKATPFELDALGTFATLPLHCSLPTHPPFKHRHLLIVNYTPKQQQYKPFSTLDWNTFGCYLLYHNQFKRALSPFRLKAHTLSHSFSFSARFFCCCQLPPKIHVFDPGKIIFWKEKKSCPSWSSYIGKLTTTTLTFHHQIHHHHHHQLTNNIRILINIPKKCPQMLLLHHGLVF